MKVHKRRKICHGSVNDELCPGVEHSRGLFCTRQICHGGNHHAALGVGYCAGSWPQKAEKLTPHKIKSVCSGPDDARACEGIISWNYREYFCTRVYGHRGDHHACGKTVCVGSWPQKTTSEGGVVR